MTAKAQASPRAARSPELWVLSGFTLQLVGAVGVAAYAWIKLRHQGIGGHITAATIRLLWHADVHTRTGLAVFAAGAVIYAAGSILMARPYVSRPVMLFAAVPAAAIAGVLVLGVLALLVAILLAALEDNFDLPLDFGSRRGGAGSGRRRRP
jgi:hypothetical protein